MKEQVEAEIESVTFITTPFYEVTNSIASLWFAKDYLDDDQVVLINGDIIMENTLV